ncbi:unnamed protein product [Brachionus calyciflorus]|uniref:RNA-directed DNA polymerase from mobile element jockey-like n=1 Tax=Brachionus calyciflorus TaxID=104777 RepID=A0A813UVI3_9BILA|nr:unnamed protein product [Brachionus calyciflorus]
MSPDELNQFITESIVESTKKAIPPKEKRISTKLPKYIVELIRFKNILKKSRNENSKYNKVNKLIKDEIKCFKNVKWQNFLKSLGSKASSSRPFWQRIKNANPKNKSKKNKIPNLIFENKSFKSDQDKSNLFGRILQETFKNSDEPTYDNHFKDEVDSIINNCNLEFSLMSHSQYKK